jgi:hypothetical protein
MLLRLLSSPHLSKAFNLIMFSMTSIPFSEAAKLNTIVYVPKHIEKIVSGKKTIKYLLREE